MTDPHSPDHPVAWRLSDLPTPPRDAPTVVSTFSCGGGSTMGYKLAGFRTLGAVDIDPDMMGTYAQNFDTPDRFIGSITDVPEGLRAKWRGKIDVLDGSPPCTSFSTAGVRDETWGKLKHFREGQAEQVLDRLFYAYLDLVADLRPRVFVAENVEGMLKGNARGYVTEVVRIARELGYDVRVFKLSGHNYGVPQMRPRVFFIGRRMDDPTVGEFIVPPKQPRVTVGKALQDTPPAPHPGPLPEVAGKAWDFIKPGQNFSAYTLAKRGKATGFGSYKLHPDRVGFTVIASGDYCHWEERRKLNRAELLRLGTFPDDYQLTGNHAAAQYLVGMSVPPYLMRAVATSVADMLRKSPS